MGQLGVSRTVGRAPANVLQFCVTVRTQSAKRGWRAVGKREEMDARRKESTNTARRVDVKEFKKG